MKRNLLSFLLVLVSISAFSQSVPFPSDPRDNNKLEPWGYQQVGTTWDTSPFLPFIYQNKWMRIIPPNGVTYTRSTKTWNYTSPGTKYPLILFFHGLGEKGTDNNNQLKHGGQRHRDAVLSGQFPGFCVYPQSVTFEAAKDIVVKMIETLPIDPNRIYVHGLSGGGGQAWDFAINYPELTAAAFPMSASRDEAKVEHMLYMPLRQSQGGLDINPVPGWTQTIVDWFNNNGGHLEYFFLPNIGHGTWNTMYNRSDFFSWFLSHKKNEIMVRYNRTENCPGDPIIADFGFTPGFEGYEWRKDGVLMPGENNFKLLPTSHGTYTGRILNRGVWSDWSAPVVIKEKAVTQTPAIQLTTLQSFVIPDVNGNSNVSLSLPAGYETYTWTKVGGGTVGTTATVVVNQTGQYQAVVKEIEGCSSIPSPAFTIIDANGSPKPDPISNLRIAAVSRTQLRITWDNTPSPVTNETGFEIWRSDAAEGPYKLVAVNPADVLTYNNTNLDPSKRYWYIVRPFTSTGAAAASDPTSGITEEDVTPPTPPNNLVATTNSNVSVNLTWSGSTDDTEVIAYDVYVRKYGQTDYIKAYSTTGLSQVVYGLEPNSLYNFVIKARDESGNSSSPSNLATAATYFKGLRYSYYQGTWSALPNFSNLTPVSTGVINNFTISPRARNDNFGFVYTGTIEILTSGSYTFFLASDDGSKIWVNNTLVVNNDGLHGTSPELSGTINLNAGYYPIRLEYFEATGGEGLTVRYQGPSISKQTIPDARLRESFTMPTAPVAPAKPTLAVLSYKSIQVNWTAYTGTGTQIEVYRSLNNSTWSIVGTVASTQTSFVDNTLSASTLYYYRLRAINSGNVSSNSSSTSATTQALPPLPAAPSSLAVQNTELTSISVAWTDNSNNEDNFELYRSVGGNSTYEKIATLSANTASFTDTDLYAHTLYYYKVLSKNVRGSSAYSNEIGVTTLNSVPVVAPVVNRAMRFDEQTQFVITATDADNDFLVFGAPALPAYAHLFDYGDGTAVLELTPTIDDLGISTFQISASDSYGGSHVISFDIDVNMNHSPVLSFSGNAMDLKETYSQAIQIQATDADSDIVTWTIEGAPAFITSQIVGNSITLTALPLLDHAGNYQFNVVATDPSGARSEQQILVSVQDYDPNFSLLVNFRKSVQTGYASFAPAPWSNINRDAFYNSLPYTSTPLTRNDGVANADITLTLNFAWGGQDSGGITTGTLFPSSVSMSSINHTSTTPQTIVLNGLNPVGKYNIKLFSSTANTGRSTAFTINGSSITLVGTNNASTTADFMSVTPAADGKITIYVARGAGSSSAIVNALVVESYFDGNTPPAAPTNLTASLNASNKVQLNWTDVASNESGYQVYRSTDNTNFSKIADVSLDIVSYLDLSVSFGNTYYYQVRAINAVGASDFSNTISIAPVNSAPTMSPVDPVTVAEANMTAIQVVASDPEAQAISFSLEGEPDFVWTEFDGVNRVNVMFEPYEGTAGNYSFQLHCDDAAGTRSSITILLTVTKRGEKEFKINFTNTSNIVPSPWNNITSSTAGASLSGLKDNMNNTSTISMTLQDTWGGINNQGYISGSNTGIYPDAATSTYFWFSGPTSVNVLFAGLDPTKRYDFTFYGSRIGSGTRNATYAIGGKSATLNAYGNISSVVKVTNIAPAANGQLTLNVLRVNDMAYLNAMVIREFTDSGLPSIPAAPSNLSSILLTKTTAKLAWNDGSDNETGFEIWRSVGDNLNYTLLTTTASNVINYTATGIVSGTTYYYKVRAKNGTGNSTFTNETSFTGYNYAVPINFYSSTSDASLIAAGWNNLTPTNLDLLTLNATYNGLKDESGVSTGVSVKVLQVFGGTSSKGMVTGNNSGIVPDGVIKGGYFIDRLMTAQLRFDNLSLLNKYNFSFFGSRDGSPTVGDRTTIYTINGVSVSLNGFMNSANIVQIRDVQPDNFGSVTVTLTTTSAALFGYLNGIIIQAVNDPDGGARAASLAGNSYSEMAEIKAYPNPFVSELTVELVEQLGDEFTVSLMNSAGVTVFESSHSEKPSNNQLKLDFSETSSGFYYLRVQDRKGFSQNKRLIKK